MSRCQVCRGPIIASYDGASCLHCGRSPQPERVSLAEALP
jgi:hypothetical protein